MIFRLLCGFCILTVAAGCASHFESVAVADGPTLEDGAVKVFRDDWGVAHIYASTEEGGFYGLGYAKAEDQLERFFLSVLGARGELAANIAPEDLPAPIGENFPGVEAMIENDYQMRLWRLRELSEAAVARLDPQLRKNYEGYLAGISAFIAEHPDRVPDWAPKDVSLADLVAIPSAQTWLSYQGGVGMNDCRRGGVPIQTAAPARSYSNQWALAPSRTATGGAILLSDPHPGNDGRYVYEFRLHAGDLRMAGYAYGPTLLLGRNESVGWAFTTGAPDVADCYAVETLDEKNLAYKYDGETKTFERRDIVIEVKGRDPVVIEAKYSDHNGVMSPIVNETPGKVHVVSTPYLGNLEGLHNAVYQMNKARNVDDIKQAQRAGWLFSQNLMAADTQGDIFYIRIGMTPVRPDIETDWRLPVNGNDSAYEWRGIHSVDDLLSVKSPAVGYLQNNNVHPRAMDNPVLEEITGLPEYILDDGTYPWEDPAGRGLRAVEAFAQIGQMTEEDAFKLAYDSVLVGTPRWTAMLADAFDESDKVLEGDLKSFVDDLLLFDGALDASSAAALKYIYWREALRDHLQQQDVQPLIAALDGKTELTTALKAAFVKAAEDAFERLLEAPLGLARTYGDEFRIAGGESRSWPMSGGSLWPNYDPTQINECFNDHVLLCPTSLLAMRYSDPDENSLRYVTAGSAIMRLDFYGPDGVTSYSAQRTGVSDVEGSPHFDDQAEKLLSRNKLKPVYFSWSALEPNIRSTTSLKYSGSGRN